MQTSHVPATIHDPAPAFLWLLRVSAEGDPLILARILQKVAVPEVGLREVRYGMEPRGGARSEVTILCTEAWANLITARISRMSAVTAVDCLTVKQGLA